MKQLHEIQLQILRKLLFAEKLHFSELKPNQKIENNQFDWHLKQLIKNELVEKQDNGYSLSIKGKKYCNKFDTDSDKIEMQAKLSAWLVCMRNTNGYNEFLLYTRKKHPFFGCQGFPSGKIRQGEKVIEAAKRELEEETGLTGEADVIFLWHFLVMDKDSGLKEDKYMFVCRFINPEGKLVENSIEGEYCWVTESNVETWLKKPFVDKEEILSLVEKAKTVKKPIMMTEERLQGDNF